ncbi:hypothetical protein KR018_010877, partial [Drosophila ironensis]
IMNVVLVFGCLIVFLALVEGKFNSLYCSVDEEYGEFKVCKLKTITRTRNSINIHFRQKMLAEKVYLRVEMMKRNNGWRPFLYDITVNLCDFAAKNNNMILNMVFAYVTPCLVRPLNCPFKPNDTVDCPNLEWSMDEFRVRFPIETGEYGMRWTFIVKNKPRVSINGSTEYRNYREH